MGHRVPWSDLPPELLSAIAKYLTSPLDISRFRSVCKSWRSSVSRPSNLLSSMLPLTSPIFPDNVDSPYRRTVSVISSTSIYLLHAPIDAEDFLWSPGLPKFWIMFVDELNPGKLYIRKPLSKSLACPLPYFFPEWLSLSDFHTLEVGKYCNLSQFTTCNPTEGNGLSFPFSRPSGLPCYVHKAVLFSNESGVLVLDDGKLFLSKLGEDGFENWVAIHNGIGFKIDDIVDYNGRVCAVNRRGKVYGIEYGSWGLNVIGSPIAGGGGRRKRLVATPMGLFLIVRYPVSERYSDAKFKIYKLEEAKKKWIEVSTLDNQIFFLGLDYSFSVSINRLAQSQSCEGNCIIFMRYSFPTYVDADDDICLFESMHQKSSHGVFHLGEGGRFDFIESFPVYSHMLWPPPFWLWANSKQCLGVTEATDMRSMVSVAVRCALERLRGRTQDIVNKAKLKELSNQELQRELVGFQEFKQQIVSCFQEVFKEIKKDSGESGSLVSDVKQEAAMATPKEPSKGPEVGETSYGIKDGRHCNNSSLSSVKHNDWIECCSLIQEVLKDCIRELDSIGGEKQLQLNMLEYKDKSRSF